MLRLITRLLADYLQKPSPDYKPVAAIDEATLKRTLQPGDVLLVEGNLRISVAIKYLTQSTWSHAAVYIGDCLEEDAKGGPSRCLVEANVKQGVIAVPLGKYAEFHTRICRPVGLKEEDREALVRFLVSRLGMQYDLKNVIDLLRYLLPTPPIPVRFRRRMLSLGSGDPTRAICSTLIAEAFQSIHYPVLPIISTETIYESWRGAYLQREIHHIRHHSLFTPRDFDISPYFRIIKPTIERGFDYRALTWGERGESAQQ